MWFIISRHWQFKIQIILVTLTTDWIVSSWPDGISLAICCGCCDGKLFITSTGSLARKRLGFETGIWIGNGCWIFKIGSEGDSVLGASADCVLLLVRRNVLRPCDVITWMTWTDAGVAAVWAGNETVGEGFCKTGTGRSGSEGRVIFEVEAGWINDTLVGGFWGTVVLEIWMTPARRKEK